MIIFNDKLLKELEAYSIYNNLDPSKFANDLLKKAFTIEKYGEKPPIIQKSVSQAEQKEESVTEPNKIQEKIDIIVETKKEEPQEEVKEAEKTEEPVKKEKKKRKLN